MNKIRQLTFFATVSLMCYIPFHAFISTWLISNFGHAVVFKSLKDVLVFGVFGLLIVCARLYKIKNPINSRLLLFIFLYLGLNIIYLIFSDVSITQKLAGFDFNMRFFCLFIITHFVGSSYKNQIKLKLILKIVVVSLGIVSLFGLLQSTVLPRNFLSHFGYDGTVIPSYFTIDGVGGLIRFSSTLRGPNVLGAYMVVTIPILVSFWIFIRKELSFYYQILFGATLFFSTATLYFTYSRSAWVGLFVALVTYLFFVFKKYKLQMLIFAALLSVAAIILVVPNRNTYFIQQVVFHVDPSEQSGINSDDQRLQSLQNGLSGVKNNVLGHGIGSAGTPSTYGDKPTIVENYFLDTAYQLGYLGLALVSLIYLYTYKQLWAIRNNWLAVSLMSSFFGLIVASMFWPVWSDETVAYTWWGVAGFVLGSIHNHRSAKRDAVN